MNAYPDGVENFRYYIVVTTKYFKSYWGQHFLIMEQWPQFFYTQESAFMNEPVLFIYRKMKEDDKVSREKNPKYESMSLEELKANIPEKSRW